MLLATGVSAIYSYDFEKDIEPKAWHEHINIGNQMCVESDVEIRRIKKELLSQDT